jgi:hypothetical protein
VIGGGSRLATPVTRVTRVGVRAQHIMYMEEGHLGVWDLGAPEESSGTGKDSVARNAQSLAPDGYGACGQAVFHFARNSACNTVMRSCLRAGDAAAPMFPRSSRTTEAFLGCTRPQGAVYAVNTERAATGREGEEAGGQGGMFRCAERRCGPGQLVAQIVERFETLGVPDQRAGPVAPGSPSQCIAQQHAGHTAGHATDCEAPQRGTCARGAQGLALARKPHQLRAARCMTATGRLPGLPPFARLGR